MVVATVGLLLASSPVAIYLHETEGIEPAKALGIVTAFSACVKDQAGVSPTVQVGVGCDVAHPDCLPSLRVESGADNLVLVRVFGGVTEIAFSAELRSTSQPMRTANAFLPADEAAWPSLLQPPALELFPRRIHSGSENVTSAVLVEDSPGPGILPWTLIGAGAVAAGVGIAFGVMSQDARSTLESQTFSDPQEYRDLTNRVTTQGTVAGVLYATAGALVVGGVIWLIAAD